MLYLLTTGCQWRLLPTGERFVRRELAQDLGTDLHGRPLSLLLDRLLSAGEQERSWFHGCRDQRIAPTGPAIHHVRWPALDVATGVEPEIADHGRERAAAQRVGDRRAIGPPARSASAAGPRSGTDSPFPLAGPSKCRQPCRRAAAPSPRTPRPATCRRPSRRGRRRCVRSIGDQARSPQRTVPAERRSAPREKLRSCLLPRSTPDWSMPARSCRSRPCRTRLRQESRCWSRNGRRRNHPHGHRLLGEPCRTLRVAAVVEHLEIQRLAEHATGTVQLVHSPLGVRIVRSETSSTGHASDNC